MRVVFCIEFAVNATHEKTRKALSNRRLYMQVLIKDRQRMTSLRKPPL